MQTVGNKEAGRELPRPPAITTATPQDPAMLLWVVERGKEGALEVAAATGMHAHAPHLPQAAATTAQRTARA